MWQQYKSESNDWTLRSESNSDQHQDSDILTISDSNEDKERGEMDARGREIREFVIVRYSFAMFRLA